MKKSNSNIIYKGFSIKKGKSTSGKIWFAADNPKGGPAFFCTKLAIAKKFIDKNNN